MTLVTRLCWAAMGMQHGQKRLFNDLILRIKKKKKKRGRMKKIINIFFISKIEILLYHNLSVY